mmetsp:Transcript_34765/g.67631  ORF Transcript_34765/g.67631 Transcript_34765/m.67631 type:complete len:206 (-) Transcript_34765:322-939(-)
MQGRESPGHQPRSRSRVYPAPKPAVSPNKPHVITSPLLPQQQHIRYHPPLNLHSKPLFKRAFDPPPPRMTTREKGTQGQGWRSNVQNEMKSYSLYRGISQRPAGPGTMSNPLTCPKCNKTLSSKYNLQVHMRAHTNHRPFSCRHCNKSFHTKCNLEHHVQRHTGEWSFICHQCGKGFTRGDRLRRHLHVHYKQQKKTEVVDRKHN